MLRRGAPKLDENGKPMRDARRKVIYEPYRIKVLNTINFKKSMKYNPFAYIRSEKDILKLVNVIIANTKGDGEKSSEDFWVKAERLLYCALIGYIWYEAEPESLFVNIIAGAHGRFARHDLRDKLLFILKGLIEVGVKCRFVSLVAHLASPRFSSGAIRSL